MEKPESSERLKVLQRGAWTQAAPCKEEKYYRKVSDSIGNSYSPSAKELSTSFIYKLLSSNDIQEPTGKLARNVQVCHGAEKAQEKVEAKQTINDGSVQKLRAFAMAISDAATQGSTSPPPGPDRFPRLPHVSVCVDELPNASLLPGPHRSRETAAGSSRPAIHLQSLRGSQEQSNLKDWECPLKIRGRDNRDSGDLGKPSQNYHLSDSQVQGAVFFPMTDSKEDYTTHDKATKGVLAISFPPYTYSTHGLSRPTTPCQEHLPRYHALIAHAFQLSEVLPLEEGQLMAIMSKIPTSLLSQWTTTLQGLTEEVQSVYREALKKAILDYVLLEPAEQARLGVHLPSKVSHSAGRLGFPWHERVKHSHSKLLETLYITHPVMGRLLHLFRNKYQTFRLLDLDEFSGKLPLSLDQVVNLILSMVSYKAKLLQDTWLQECAQIVEISRDSIEAWMPQDNETQRMRRMNHFFRSVATLMSSLLRELVTNSLLELVEWLEQYHLGNNYDGLYPHETLGLPVRPHFIIIFLEPLGEQTDLNITPWLDDIERSLDAVVSHLVCSVQKYKCVEHQLFQAVEKLEIRYIPSVQTDEDMVLSVRGRIRAVLKSNDQGPRRYLSVYAPYLPLLSVASIAKMEEFVNKDPSLQSCNHELERLKRMTNELMFLPAHVPMELLLLDCTHTNQWLLDRTQHLTRIIMNKVVSDSEKINRSICHQYEEIMRKVTGPIGSTEELVQLQNYVDELWSGDLLRIKKQLELAATNILFLMGCTHLSKEDIILNGNTFSWPDRIVPLMKNSKTRLQREHDKAVQRLHQRQREFSQRMAEVAKLVKGFQRRDRMSEAQQYVEQLQGISGTIQGFIEEKKQINQEEVLLDTGQVGCYPEIQELLKAKEPYDQLWLAALSFNQKYEEWLNGPLLQIKAEEVNEQVQSLWKSCYKLTKELYHPELHGPLKVATAIKTKLEKFRINMPLINALCCPGIKHRHWKLMSQKVGTDILPEKSTSLKDILPLGLEKHLEELALVSVQASKEYALEQALLQMEQDWEHVHFNFVTYQDRGVSVLAAVDDIQLLLDDHIVKTTTMKGSAFIAPFEEQILSWEARLKLMQDVLDVWLRVQMGWLYLEPIFSSEDIRNQIPIEGKLFEAVDFIWRQIMKDSEEVAVAMQVISQFPILERLKEAEAMLDNIQRGLNDYLEMKRLSFPRFFFLSNDELLEILSETRDPLRVQPHLKKCFEGIARLTFSGGSEVTHIESAEGERVELVRRIVPAQANGLVERWLLQVEKLMKESLQLVMMKSITAYPETLRQNWVLQWPGQVVLATSAIYWTMEVSQAMALESGLQCYLEKITKQMDDIVMLVRGKLTKMERLTLSALITIDVHARDVVVQLDELQVCNISDFHWVAQLRYYWEEDRALVRMVTMALTYGYEYLGNTGRLVITPLTDRCYRTLMGALQLNLGGAPEGPAGTGKTETCKDLAKAVAKQCVVFNCSDGLDYKAMGKFFKGLAQSGAWACFDEFNRIELEVLSVVAQQIQTIQRAVSQRAETFVFEGTRISLDPSCTVFITMNPGYAGRAKLPDNLKVLFRTVAMMVPDYALIAEITLYAMGFVDARNLATKIVATYRLCSEQLSSQHHYDYGMRAVKSVLTAAGNLKVSMPDVQEDRLMLRSIMDVNLPKFLSQDLLLFQSIISDLFPGVQLPKADHSVMETAAVEICQQWDLQPVPWFINKVIQIYEMMLVRHGFMLVGGPLGGKSTALHVLAQVLGLLESRARMEEKRVDSVTINPKSLSMGQLYGSFDPVSHEWTDGVLATVFREHASSWTAERKWVVFDGPVDAVWVENLNTVLDDNKKLCLMSGEIIQMSPQQNIIFEVLDLEQASPATVSRCGMIYMEPMDLGWKPLFHCWMETKLPDFITSEQKQLLKLLCEWLLPPCLAFVQKNCHTVVPSSMLHLAVTMMQLYECLLADLSSLDSEVKKEDNNSDKNFQTSLIVAFGFFSVVWSVGGFLDFHSKQRFAEFFKRLCDPESTFPRPKDLKFPRALHIPRREGIYSYVFLKRNFPAWHLWKDLILPSVIEDNVKLSDYIVSTEEALVQKYFLEKLLLRGKPLMFVGPTGTGKSAITISFLQHLPADQYVIGQVNFSALTTASYAQDAIVEKLERKRRGLYGAPSGKRVLLFVDDLNMPTKERYGAQPPIELLRQLIEHGTFWDRKDNSSLSIKDMSIVAAIAPSSGGRQEITPRLLRHFNIISINTFSEQTMKTIFQPLMDWHFSQGFENSLKRFSKILVWATTELYTQVTQAFLPTPSKSHYTFNFRDFSRVIQGLLLLKSDVISAGTEGARKLMRLWIHETHRVFCDRLVDDKDRQLFFRIVKGVVQAQFKEKMSTLFSHMVIGREVQPQDLRGLFFGDYLTPRSENKTRRFYNEILDTAQLKLNMEHYLEELNKLSKTPMDLVMFQFAIEHVSRLCRIFKQPWSHALLIGIGGSGRQSSTRLAAFVSEMELFQITIQKSYCISEWREDIRRVLRKAGLSGTPSVFFFADHQIKEESFLEDISSLLNTGDIPGLFDSEEQMDLIEKMRQLIPADVRDDAVTPTKLYKDFLQRVRSNLHIVLAFSPIGEAFHNHLRQFPTLVNCCTIDWFQAWPEDALEKVACYFLDDVDMSQGIRKGAVFLCRHFHQSVMVLSQRFFESLQRRIYVTPTSYLELIKTFKRLLESKRLELLTNRNRYLTGLEKLDFASAQIALMQLQLRELEPLLVERSKETVELLVIIAQDTLEVETVKKEVEAEEAIANKAAQEAQAIKDECEQNLSIAMPALNAAIAALDTLKASDITLIKTMQNPPSGVRLTLAAICILKGIKPEKRSDSNGRNIDDYWPSAKKMLGDMKFLESLKEYDKDNIPFKVIAQIRRDFISNPDFEPAVIKNVSSACEGLCSWVRAIEVYDKVTKIVAPKRQRLQAAEAELKVQKEKLSVTQSELSEVSTKLFKLQQHLSQKIEEKQSLEKSMEQTKLKLGRAEKLMSGLGGERERWMQISQQLDDTYQNIVGDMLLSAGVVAYLGPFTPQFRQEVLKDWQDMCKRKEIPVSPTFSLSTTLGDAVTIMEWQVHGLPRDMFSVENAIIITSARRWPLMIDPQGQANKWIKSMEKVNKLHVCKATDHDYLRVLSNCIQFGTPMLLENLSEELDPLLEPLLLRQTFRHNGMEFLRLGEVTVQYSQDFRFYLTTQLRNPHYLPEVSLKVNLLNFMITPTGLEDQLLSILTAKEKPELENTKRQLYREEAQNRKQLKEVENQILEVLSLSQGNILEDEHAIHILSSSRKLSQEILEKQQITMATEREIDDTRDGYRPVANQSSVLFFVISNLANIDPMYQYSLAWFLNLYVKSISESESSVLLYERIDNLNKHFTYSIYQNICRSLFEKHKLLFLFLLCVGLQSNRGQVDETEWRFLLTGGVALENPYKNPAPDWLKNQSWTELMQLSTFPAFNWIRENFTNNVPWWKNVYDSAHPNEMTLPEPWDDLLSDFQKLLILRCIRPDKIIPAVQHFIIDNMGPSYVEPPTFDLQCSYMDSTCSTPLVFILSPGADPMAVLVKFAEEKGMGGAHLQTVSLGQGQGPIARNMIEKAAAEGTWVVLQNCHLAPSWLPDLEQICEELLSDQDLVKPGFRLWLTSYPSSDFPISILQNGIKMTNEPPKGLRANLLRSYLSNPISDPTFYEGCSKKEEWEKLLFSLCLFHGLVQERRMFGPLGWNIPYEFNESDLHISARQVQMFLNTYSEVPLDALSYLIGECNYGGRVTDSFDRRLLLSLLDTCYCLEMLTNMDYSFSSSGVYRLPAKSGFNNYLEHIKSLPMSAEPEVFGLHENASITREYNETQELFNGILATLPKQVTGARKSSIEIVQELTTDILSKMPPDFSIEDVMKRFPITYAESMNTVLVQELLRFNQLTSTIRGSLRDLSRALQGQALMSGELEDIFNSIIVGKVPALWSSKSYPSLKPLGSYISDLLLRLHFFKCWTDDGAPTVFWISGFYFTQCFLTGVLQNHARKSQVPIDQLNFQFHLTEYHTEQPPSIMTQESGVYIKGIFIEGASWDTKKRTLKEVQPTELYESLPIILLQPQQKSTGTDGGTYTCPVYNTSIRRGELSTTGHSTNYIMTVDLPSEKPQKHWINRGVACLCQLDY
ncbi:dynein axonemal heavy chain 3-like isoform X1 [Erpetoichthys calabaricus]|uniref:dynein axonemal heavy chain 3-like isoform X1 n=2 Tax=Erpetoichthys calabaricus TaxID=27687 RepID=UPI002234CB2C|nr:dynein axonemal heavy chain 3-like isoform X1 [Erpetoichthys calabaricus]